MNRQSIPTTHQLTGASPISDSQSPNTQLKQENTMKRAATQSSPITITRSIAAAAVAAALAFSSHAATITWLTPQDITGSETDISTTGTGLLGYNGAADNSSQTVNGVTFSNSGVGKNDYTYTQSGVTMTLTGFNGNFSPWANYNPGSGEGVPSLTGDYLTLLEDGAYSQGSASGSINLSGLSIGNEYEVQLWVIDGRNATNAARTQVLTGSTDTTMSYKQYVIGTFKADSTVQSIAIDGSSFGLQVNAFQLRLVPEPGSLALFAIGSVLIVRRRRS